MASNGTNLKNIISQGERNIAKQLVDDTQKLQMIAAEFLKKMEKYGDVFTQLSLSQQDYKKYHAQLKDKSTDPKTISEANAALARLRLEINQLAMKKELFREISTLSDQFRADLLELLGKKILVVMVTPKGKDYIVDETNVDQVVRYERRQGQVIERFKYLNKKIQDMAEQTWPKIQAMIRLNAIDDPVKQEQFTAAANTTYLVAQQRYQKTSQNKHFQKHGIILHPYGRYIFFTINTKGDIAEGYVGLLYTTSSTQKIDFLNIAADIEQALWYLLDKYVRGVGNAAGLLVGDITVGDYEIQVKSAQGSSVYFYQAQNLAMQIINEHWTIEDLKKYIENSRNDNAVRNAELALESEEEQIAMEEIHKTFKH